MARGKKQSLAAEELLEQTLLPEEEQPYKVPKNWTWTYIRCVSKFERGITFPSSAKNSEKGPNLIACIRTANVQENLELDDLLYIDKSYVKENKDKLLRLNDIVMSSANSRELVGKVSYVDSLIDEMTFGGFVLAIRAQNINSKYLFYMLRLQFLSGKFMGESTQTTNIANISTKSLGNYAFPLPPIAEQQRIIDRIESLFAKLDQAKELAQNALDSFETRKAAILHKAFTGELTAEWREEHNVGLDSWEEILFGSIIDSGPQNGLYKPKSAYGKGYRIVRIDSFYEGTINPWHSLKELSLEDNEIKLYGLRNNDIIINRVNSMEYLGKSALVRELEDTCVFESNIMRLALNRSIADPEFITRYLNSTKGLTELRKNAKQAVNQASINQSDVKNSLIPLPSLFEQQEVVRILERMLGREQEALELARVIDKIELMKKAILARAFRGELGTNDPSEQSSLELLTEVVVMQ